MNIVFIFMFQDLNIKVLSKLPLYIILNVYRILHFHNIPFNLDIIFSLWANETIIYTIVW